MNEFLKSFSNRETALFVWVFAILGVLILKKENWKLVLAICKAFFVKKLLILFISFIAYTTLCFFALFKVGFWDSTLIKDSIFWTFGFALLTIFNTNKAKSKAYFKDIFIGALKWTVMIEFILSFYTFSLSMELLILPIVTFAVIVQAFSKTDAQYNQVGNSAKSLLSVIGIIVFAYVIFKTFTLSSALMTADNLKSFVLPIVMTILFMPFIYVLALFIQYEELFVRLDFISGDREQQIKIKRQILKIANIDLDKLMNISRNIAKKLLIDKESSFEVIKNISQQTN